MTSMKPDFYTYRADGTPAVLDVTRECWKLATVYSDQGKEITVVKIAPPFPPSAHFRVANKDVIGLASRSTIFKVGEFGEGFGAEVVVWEVKELGNGNYLPITSVGLITIWKDPPGLVPN